MVPVDGEVDGEGRSLLGVEACWTAQYAVEGEMFWEERAVLSRLYSLLREAAFGERDSDLEELLGKYKERYPKSRRLDLVPPPGSGYYNHSCVVVLVERGRAGERDRVGGVIDDITKFYILPAFRVESKGETKGETIESRPPFLALDQQGFAYPVYKGGILVVSMPFLKNGEEVAACIHTRVKDLGFWPVGTTVRLDPAEDGKEQFLQLLFIGSLENFIGSLRSLWTLTDLEKFANLLEEIRGGRKRKGGRKKKTNP